MPVEVTARAIDVLRRALELGRMDAARIGVRVSVARGGELRTSFAEEAEAGELTLETGGVRLFVPQALAAGDAVLDVTGDHDRLVLL